MRSAIFALFGMIALPLPGVTGDSFVGTWRLNAAESRFAPTGPGGSGIAPLKSSTIRFKRSGKGVAVSEVTVESSGNTVRRKSVEFIDGKDHPSPDSGGTKSCTRLEENAIECASKINGAIIWRSRRTVSEDGKTLTVEVHKSLLTNSDLQALRDGIVLLTVLPTMTKQPADVLVYDRVK